MAVKEGTGLYSSLCVFSRHMYRLLVPTFGTDTDSAALRKEIISACVTEALISGSL